MRGGHHQRGLTIGLISVYFGLFDEAMPPSFRADRERYARQVATMLEAYGDVLFPGLVDTEEAGRAAGEQLASSDVDVVVFAPSMAAPPSYGWLAMERLPDVPLIVVGGQEERTVPDDYDTEEATRRSLPVGVVMFTNVLVRSGRAFSTVIGERGAPDFEARLADAMRAASGVAAIRGARLAALGTPMSGYLDVEASPEELAKLGIDVVEVSRERLNRAFRDSPAEAVDAQLASDRERFDTKAMDDDVLERSARLVCALRSICLGDDLSGGAVNCHGDHFRWNPEVGITACLAVSHLSEEGRSFACTGDLPTAAALLLGKSISGSSLYCELYQLDLDGDWLLVANGGEGDLAARDPKETVRLLPEDHYSGEKGPGTAVAFGLPAGPTTLISLTPAAGARGNWRLITAEGEIIGSRHDAMEGPNGMFSFAGVDVQSGYLKWCEAGATHHAALLAGHQADTLQRATDMLGIEHDCVAASSIHATSIDDPISQMAITEESSAQGHDVSGADIPRSRSDPDM